MKLYLMTTQDIYELPLAVTETLDEMAKLTGTPKTTIAAAISHTKHYAKKSNANNRRPKWHRIEVEDE